jgi:hypothetical protein
MIYLFNKKLVKIDLNNACENRMLIMDSEGNKVIEELHRATVDRMSADGIGVSGFKEIMNNKFKFVEYYFSYNI